MSNNSPRAMPFPPREMATANQVNTLLHIIGTLFPYVATDAESGPTGGKADGGAAMAAHSLMATA
jgi:hypothetical protein